MAQSWDEFKNEHKSVPLLKSSTQSQDQRTAFACRLCKQVFFGNKTLVNHFQSHFNPDRTFNPNSLVQSFVPPENEIRHNTNQSHSFPTPLNSPNLVANENLGSNARQTFVSEPFKLSLGNSLVSPLSKKSVQFTFRHQPYPSPSIVRSTMNRGVLGPRPNVPHQMLCSPVGSKTPAIFNSKITEGSNFCFPMKQSSFYPPAIVDKASQFFAGNSGLGRGKILQMGMKNIVVGPLTVCTKPYIKKLEQPIEQMPAGHNDASGDNDGDELDLTLKL